MIIREYTTYHAQEILALYEGVGWFAYTNDLESLRQGFANSLLTLAAYDEQDSLIGLVRTIGDGHTIVFIQDLLVSPAHQRRGIGTSLMREILARFSHVRQIELVCDVTPDVLAFYHSLNFVELSSINCQGLMYKRGNNDA